MKKSTLFILITISFLSSHSWNHALAQTEINPKLRTTNETGCYTTDGKFTVPTIVMAVGLYHEPDFPKDRALKIIDVAISSGCNIEEPDEAGSTPLIASIIYNEPEMAKILLHKGANPYLKMSSSKKYLDNLNSFEITELLIKKQLSQNREKIYFELNLYRK
ncbi:hypothetical protein [Pseudomonas sp.]|uniref:hypothetical protein n=1 Tax=Pseudomonas sp. TaxID=306 RepID=UPI00299D7489|nr:hypothetical protein [Pseudomonas sp.]MDX1366810.1 hypothetical protein [Pseudomonas sp.]